MVTHGAQTTQAVAWYLLVGWAVLGLLILGAELRLARKYRKVEKHQPRR